MVRRCGPNFARHCAATDGHFDTSADHFARAPAAPINGPVTLSSVSQTSGIAVGATVILTGSGFTADNTILLDGMAAVKDAQVASSANGHQTIAFTMPSSVGPDCKPDEACAMYLRLLTSGTYNLAVENEKRH